MSNRKKEKIPHLK